MSSSFSITSSAMLFTVSSVSRESAFPSFLFQLSKKLTSVLTTNPRMKNDFLWHLQTSCLSEWFCIWKTFPNDNRLHRVYSYEASRTAQCLTSPPTSTTSPVYLNRVPPFKVLAVARLTSLDDHPFYAGNNALRRHSLSPSQYYEVPFWCSLFTDLQGAQISNTADGFQEYN